MFQLKPARCKIIKAQSTYDTRKKRKSTKAARTLRVWKKGRSRTLPNNPKRRGAGERRGEGEDKTPRQRRRLGHKYTEEAHHAEQRNAQNRCKKKHYYLEELNQCALRLSLLSHTYEVTPCEAPSATADPPLRKFLSPASPRRLLVADTAARFRKKKTTASDSSRATAHDPVLSADPSRATATLPNLFTSLRPQIGRAHV